MSNQTPAGPAAFDPLGKPDLVSFLKAMKQAGYYTTHLPSLNATHDALMDMATGPAFEGNVVSVLLDGKPGVGKSYLARCVARILRARYFIYNCHPDASREELVVSPNVGAIAGVIYEIPRVLEEGATMREVGKMLATKGAKVDTLTKDAFDKKRKDYETRMKALGKEGATLTLVSREQLWNMGPLLNAFAASQEAVTVLLLDEMDKGRTAVDAVLLTALQEGEIYLEGWGENDEVGRVRANRRQLAVFIAKNQARELENALYRRPYSAWVDYPPLHVEVAMLVEQAGIGEEAAKMLVTLATRLRRSEKVEKEPSFDELRRLATQFLGYARRECKEKVALGTDGKPTGVRAMVCNIPRDVLNETFIAGIQAKPDERDTSVKVMAPKWQSRKRRWPNFFGTQLLKAVLRGEGVDEKVKLETLSMEAFERRLNS